MSGAANPKSVSADPGALFSFCLLCLGCCVSVVVYVGLDEYLKKLSVEGNERLPLVSGGEIPSTFDDPESVKLGYRDLIAKILIGGGHYLVGFCYKL
ncbi:T-complex protein 1 subunit beta [Trifolium repens]|nr:T-complex protein 1 subunit beta [Trifolium repens]